MGRIGAAELVMILVLALVMIVIPIGVVALVVRGIMERRVKSGFVASRSCPHCGQRVPDIGTYCPLCGQRNA